MAAVSGRAEAPEASRVEVSYRPGRSVWIPIALIAAVLAVFVWFWLHQSSQDHQAWMTSEKIQVLVIALVPVVIAYRLATIRVKLRPDGVVIRNVLRTTRLAWSQVSALRYEPADSWLQLVTGDGRRIGILAIQRADGDATGAKVQQFTAYARRHGAGRPD